MTKEKMKEKTFEDLNYNLNLIRKENNLKNREFLMNYFLGELGNAYQIQLVSEVEYNYYMAIFRKYEKEKPVIEERKNFKKFIEKLLNK